MLEAPVNRGPLDANARINFNSLQTLYHYYNKTSLLHFGHFVCVNGLDCKFGLNLLCGASV